MMAEETGSGSRVCVCVCVCVCVIEEGRERKTERNYGDKRPNVV